MRVDSRASQLDQLTGVIGRQIDQQDLDRAVGVLREWIDVDDRYSGDDANALACAFLSLCEGPPQKLQLTIAAKVGEDGKLWSVIS